MEILPTDTPVARLVANLVTPLVAKRATHVPVGNDQNQHLEFARECVTNFNHAYGEILVQPGTITCRALISFIFVAHLMIP